MEHRRISVPADRMEHRDDSTAISGGQEVRSQERGNIDGQGGGAGYSMGSGRGSAG